MGFLVYVMLFIVLLQWGCVFISMRKPSKRSIERKFKEEEIERNRKWEEGYKKILPYEL